MNTETITELSIGTIFPCYTQEVNHSGWIVCDGREYDNLDGRFDSLLEMEIGKKGDDGKYISPDFRNMEFIDTSATENETFVRTFDKIIKNDGHVHSFSSAGGSRNRSNSDTLRTDYMNPGVSIFHYNSDFIYSFMELYKNRSCGSVLWIMKYM
jgi:hypothetical protein